jgi:hypothetical protein
MKEPIMNRWTAAGFHLSISFVVACAVMLCIRFLLYPDFYFYISGGIKLLLLIVAVDVVIGPLLTLIVYRKGKKTLKFDLAIIVMLQLAALVYGTHAAWVARPAYNVFVMDRFVVVSSVDLEKERLKKAKAEYRSLPYFGPRLVGAQVPTAPDEQFSLAFSAMAGSDIEVYPQYYAPFESIKDKVVERSKPLSDLREKTPEASALIDSFLRRQKGREESYRYLPIKGFSPDSMSMIVTADGTPVTALAIDPW